MKDIFISYRRKTSSAFASFLNMELTRHGYEVFFDYESIKAENYIEAIDRAIDDCSFFIVLLAPGDLDRSFENPDKDWIVYETKRAMERAKIIIPVSFFNDKIFPDDCSAVPVIDALSKINICYLDGPASAELISKKLIAQFMKDNPIQNLIAAYNRGIIDPDFVAWECETLRQIYHDIPFVHVFNADFPAAVIQGSPEITFPFFDLTKEESLAPVGKPIDYQNSPYYSEFKRIVGPNIHFPNLYGYTSNGYTFDGNGYINGMLATPRTYKETVFTCHILHYELLQAYQQLKGSRIGTLDDLPMRKRIHEGHSNMDVILSGCNRSALNDVCIAVMDYNDVDEEYQISVGIRSMNVATYPGYWSIIPAGGFELYELETFQSADTIAANYKVIGALYREYIEELFGDTNYDKATGDDDLNRLYRDERIRALRRGIRSGMIKMEFLGVVFDLTTLRQTLSFVLRIDDPDFYNNATIQKNAEHSKMKFRSLKQLETEIMHSDNPVMTESAAVYTLLKKNHLYTEIAQNDFRLIPD